MQAAFGNSRLLWNCRANGSLHAKANSADQKGMGDNLACRLPGVEGGAGSAADVIGGGNGFAIGKNAKPEAVDS